MTSELTVPESGTALSASQPRSPWPNGNTTGPRPRRGHTSTRPHAGRRRFVATLLIGLSTVGLLANGLVLAWKGLLVDDEGWYLQAARAVAHGQLPYRDFAFTQGPLSAYLYAPGQAITGGSLLAGRITALAVILVLFAVAVHAAWRSVGPLAGAAVAVLLAADTGTTWALSMAKTYNFTALWLVAMAACLVRARSRERALAWATLFAGLAALTRFSASATWLLVSLACLLAARSLRGRLLVGIAALVPVVVYGGLYAAAPAQTRFDLWHYHQLTVQSTDLASRLRDLVVTRLPDVAETYAIALTVGCWAVAMTLSATGAWSALRHRPGPIIAAAGTVAFMVGNFGAGEWHNDYLIPAVPATFLLSVVATGLVLGRHAGASLAPVPVAAVLVGALLILQPGWGIGLDHYPGDRTALGRAEAMAARLDAVTSPGDRVLALHGAAVAVEANRETVPGDSLAQFSYIDIPTPDARRLGVLNSQMLVGLVRRAEPRAVLLSDWDRVLLGRRGAVSDQPGDAAPFLAALDSNYRPVAVQPGYGQGESTLTLYVRR